MLADLDDKILMKLREIFSFYKPKCIRCGKPRDNEWLLACVSCYLKEHPEEAKNYGR